MLKEVDSKENLSISLETVMLFDLKQLLRDYEEKIFTCLFKRDYKACENNLMDFCIDLLELPEKEQLFTVRIFFTSMITDILRIQTKKGPLHPDALAYAYELLYEIEKWENISEFMLHISSLMNQLKTFVIADHLMYKGNEHVEEALILIHNHLQGNYLNVNWIATQLDISPTHLTNLFKQHLEQSPSMYIEQKKIDAIIKEITNTNQTLKEIRKAYGFTNHSYFIQYFKKHTGLTPLQYVQKNRHLVRKK